MFPSIIYNRYSASFLCNQQSYDGEMIRKQLNENAKTEEICFTSPADIEFSLAHIINLQRSPSRQTPFQYPITSSTRRHYEAHCRKKKKRENELKTVDGKIFFFFVVLKIPSHSQITRCVVKRNGKTVYCRRSNEVRRGRVFWKYLEILSRGEWKC